MFRIILCTASLTIQWTASIDFMTFNTYYCLFVHRHCYTAMLVTPLFLLTLSGIVKKIALTIHTMTASISINASCGFDSHPEQYRFF